MIYYLYKITNNINSKFYIGVHSTCNLDDGYMGSGIYLKKAYKKYGMVNFTKEIISYYETREEMLKDERNIVNITLLKNKKCYNVALGGGSGIPNMVPVIDEYGNSFIIHKDDERYKNGIVQHNLKGTVPVLDEEGKYFRININDPDYINGKYKHNTTNLKWISRNGIQIREHVDKIKATDILCRKNIIDTVVINKNGINKQVKKKKINCFIDDGWVLGKFNLEKYIWVKTDSEEHLIKEKDKEMYLTNGWKLGKLPTTSKRIWVNDGNKNMLIDKKSLNGSLHIGKLKETHKKYIHKDNEMKYVHIDGIDEYIKAGWKMGKKKIRRNMHHLVTIVNIETNKIKRIDKNSLDGYIYNGWKRGRKV